MAELTRSIDIDAAITEVDREWTQFMFRLLVGHYGTALTELEFQEADDAQEAGVVNLEALPDGRTRVSVTVRYQGDERKVGAHLERDLSLFKSFAETRD